jgi:hypothetical protein
LDAIDPDQCIWSVGVILLLASIKIKNRRCEMPKLKMRVLGPAFGGAALALLTVYPASADIFWAPGNQQ